jgi:hypothetical protein
MNRRSLYCMLLCLAFTIRTFGQQTTTYTTDQGGTNTLLPTVQSKLSDSLLGVVIENWHYDPAQKAVILHLVNRSNKDVTAFNISITEKYADGSTSYLDGRPSDIHDHQMMEDMLGSMINIQMGVVSHGSGTLAAGTANNVRAMRVVRQGTESSNGTFAAGTSRDYVDYVGKDVSNIDAVVDVVAYADGTADVLNNDRAFRNLVAERKGRFLAMEKVNEVIKRALADPMVSDPVSAALNELLPFAESLNAKTKNGSPEVAENNVARNLQGDIQNLQRMQQEKTGATLGESLARYVEYYEKLIALTKPHCELVPHYKDIK